MAGSSSITGNQTVTFTDNMSFDGTDRGGAMTTDGQLWIGATASNRANDGGHVRLGSITSSDGSINVVNGPGSIDIRGQAQGFQPNAVLQLFDDFIPSGSNDDDGGQLGWRSYGSGVNTITTLSANHPGIMEISSITFGGGFTSAGFGLYDKLDHNGIIVGGGNLSVSWVVDLITLSNGTNRYITNLGLSDAPADPFLNGIYFSYSDNINGGNWSANCQSGGVTTSADTGVAAATGFNTFTVVVNSAGTSVNYLINNVSVATVATNIPTVALSFFVNNVPVIGSTPLTQVDLFWFVNSLSNPRPGPTNPSTSGANGRLLLSYTSTPISYQVLGTDAIIGVTSTAAARTITMPNASLTTGQQWEIKDESGGAATNNITVSGNGFNIDGAANYVISTNYGSVSIYWSGSNFYLV